MTPLQSTARRIAPLALAGLLAATGAPAMAAFVPSGGGSTAGLPLYRALVFGGIDTQAGTSPGYLSQDIVNGVDYTSNTAPLSVATGGGSVSAGGGTLSANGWSADSGFMASRNHASISVSQAQASDDYYMVAGQGGTKKIHLQANAPVAAATFTWHVSGQASTSGLGTADARLDFGATTSPGTDWTSFLFGGGGNTMTRYGTGTHSYTYNGLNGSELDLFLYYWTSAYTVLQHDTFATGSSAQLTADFGSTYVLQIVALFDAQGDAITDWSMTDADSGELLFDETGRLAAIADAPVVGAVPEPATALLLGAALVPLALSRRRVTGQPVRP